MKIGVLGIGGVGGYFGGRLAEYYQQSAGAEIVFITRPSTGETIRSNGLKLITPDGERIIHPHLTAWEPEEIGRLDVLICATKSYDLREALTPLAPCITSDTLIVPLLNGVNAKETIAALFPEATVADGCVYVNAKRLEPGVVQKTGAIEKLFFGNPAGKASSRMQELQSMFLAAGIESYLSEHIERDVWEKFVFTAGMATTTSYFDESIGAVLQNNDHRLALTALVNEAYAVAQAKQIPLPADMVETTIEKLGNMPFEGTSSMHRDFQKGGKTEYRSLTKYVADLGDELNVETPVFDEIVAVFDQRESDGAANTFSAY